MEFEECLRRRDTYHVGIISESSENGSGRVLILVEPAHFESKDLGEHLLSYPLRQVLPHGTKVVVLHDVDDER